MASWMAGCRDRTGATTPLLCSPHARSEVGADSPCHLRYELRKPSCRARQNGGRFVFCDLPLRRQTAENRVRLCARLVTQTHCAAFWSHRQRYAML